MINRLKLSVSAAAVALLLTAGAASSVKAAGTLVERQRTGTVDNTSVFNEKLPGFLTSILATEAAN